MLAADGNIQLTNVADTEQLLKPIKTGLTFNNSLIKNKYTCIQYN